MFNLIKIQHLWSSSILWASLIKELEMPRVMATLKVISWVFGNFILNFLCFKIIYFNVLSCQFIPKFSTRMVSFDSPILDNYTIMFSTRHKIQESVIITVLLDIRPNLIGVRLNLMIKSCPDLPMVVFNSLCVADQ